MFTDSYMGPSSAFLLFVRQSNLNLQFGPCPVRFMGSVGHEMSTFIYPRIIKMRCCIEYMPQHIFSIWLKTVAKYARYKPQFDLISGTRSLALTRTRYHSGIGKTYTMLCSFTRAIRQIMPIQFRRIPLYSVRLSSLLYVTTTNARVSTVVGMHQYSKLHRRDQRSQLYPNLHTNVLFLLKFCRLLGGVAYNT